MKNFIYLSLAFLLSIALIAGCKKDHSENVLSLIAKKTTIKYNELDTLILLGAENDSIKWDVNPLEGLSSLYKFGNKVVVVFTKAGTYAVTATDAGHTPLSKTITVLDQDFNPPPPPPQHQSGDTTINIPITGDLVITPTYFKVPNADSTGFKLMVQTSNTYPCGNSYLNIRSFKINDSYVVNAINIVQPPATLCTMPDTQLKGTMNFNSMANSSIVPDNSYPLTITVGSTTYTGSITFNQTYMDITWNYTSGVIFSSKHITL
ncbi:hypothetical protein [Mucilaginibacter panaciglaebae]|uniref:Uncharacterized protein n=1 Tax=Mucilaginibacter panaciglaebae TaxID=502331 RepID=A0ABP7WNY1_9SPHI